MKDFHNKGLVMKPVIPFGFPKEPYGPIVQTKNAHETTENLLSMEDIIKLHNFYKSYSKVELYKALGI
jgi:hypothetical protein